MLTARHKVALVASAAIASYLVDSRVRDSCERLARFSRVAAAVAAAVADEKLSAPAPGGARPAALDERQAARLLDLAQRNGFLFHKLGQYASAHPNTPALYKRALSSLLDRTPPRAAVDVEAVLAADLGAPSPLAAIEPEPIASASIAQVHKGWLRSGAPVAVKIQHRDLEKIAGADVAVMDALFLGLHYAYPLLSYMRATWPEWRATLLRELDFHGEARNAARVAAHFAADARIHVPAVHAAASSRRVLTMEWVEGTTLRALLEEDAGAAGAVDAPTRRAVGAAASDFFAQQVLVHGFVHCDPHAANLMFRRRAGGAGWQLVVIDHGMYKQLSPEFRGAFCALWRAMLTLDDAGARAATRALGLVDGDAEALSQILTFRSTAAGGRLGAEKTKAEWDKLRADYAWVTPAVRCLFLLRRCSATPQRRREPLASLLHAPPFPRCPLPRRTSTPSRCACRSTLPL